MYTCQKSYRDIPFAHRQHRHDSHCALVHGHNWTFTLEFASRELDALGFVFDFGKMGFIRDEIVRRFDHAFVFDRADGESRELVALRPGLFKALEVECSSCEGLAKYLHDLFDPQLRAMTGGRVWVRSAEVEEDGRNAATYRPE
jgi:6-pyruvoyltetrahydropterin/6-carboxytetrahydropterin synthase